MGCGNTERMLPPVSLTFSHFGCGYLCKLALHYSYYRITPTTLPSPSTVLLLLLSPPLLQLKYLGVAIFVNLHYINYSYYRITPTIFTPPPLSTIETFGCGCLYKLAHYSHYSITPTIHTHRRMGPLWLGGAEGLTAQNFTQITGADTGFPEGGGDFTSTPPPWTLSAWRHPPSGKLKNTPLPPLLLPKKRTAAAQKTELPKSWGVCSPPCPPASYAYVTIPLAFWSRISWRL